MSDKNKLYGEIEQKLKRLPTLPGIALKILETIQKETPSTREIADIIVSDAALSARILQYANSPFYARSEKLISVHQAIAFLGLTEVKNLALSFSLIKTYATKGKHDFDHVQFWKDSLIGAIAAELVAKQVDPHHAESAFCLGLLQNIGTLLLALSMPEQYRAVVFEAETEAAPVHAAESRHLGINHAELGEYVLKSWGLSENLAAAIGLHHQYPAPGAPADGADESSRVLAISALVIDLFAGAGNREWQAQAERLIEVYGYSKMLNMRLIAEATAERISRVFPQFELEVDETRLIEILEAANGELSGMTSQLAREAHFHAIKLQRLKEEVDTDGLTQVNNHRRLLEILNYEISCASLGGTPLSIIMADIDHFKSINDFFGHLAGDQVLKSIAIRLRDELRGGDQIARYGGEEFTIILPETTIEEAWRVAERLRKVVELMRIEHKNRRISVTLSLGIATLEEGHRMDAESLIKLADEALYDAKKAGRNRSCRFTPKTPVAKNPKTLLVIDDEDVVLLTVTAMLDRLGYNVVSARDGHEGIERFRQNRENIDLVILDIIIPDMNVGDVIARIRAERPDVKLMLSSGYEIKEKKQKALLDSTDGFLQKPYEMSELSEAVAAILARDKTARMEKVQDPACIRRGPRIRINPV
jgi:diguanylate cyclase (GGDEF)-like protein